jgi:hypothetical protein
MPYRMAGIDVHKKRLVVVVADVELRAIVLQKRGFGKQPNRSCRKHDFSGTPELLPDCPSSAPES